MSVSQSPGTQCPSQGRNYKDAHKWARLLLLLFSCQGSSTSVEATARGCEELSNLLQLKTRVKPFFSSLSISYPAATHSPAARYRIVKTAANYMIDPCPSSRKNARRLLFCVAVVNTIVPFTESDDSKRASATYSSESHWLRVWLAFSHGSIAQQSPMTLSGGIGQVLASSLAGGTSEKRLSSAAVSLCRAVGRNWSVEQSRPCDGRPLRVLAWDSRGESATFPSAKVFAKETPLAFALPERECGRSNAPACLFSCRPLIQRHQQSPSALCTEVFPIS